jgi:hypothetical protein
MLDRGPAWLILVSLLFGCNSGNPIADGGVAPEGGIRPGDACAGDGGSVPAPDGCNTCSCVAGTWACTDIACPTPCTPGEMKPASDGCNTCRCTGDRTWSCTLVACPIDAGVEGGGPPGPPDTSTEGGGPPAIPDASTEGGGPPGTPDASIEGGGPPTIPDAGANDGRPCGNFGDPFEGGVPPQVYEGGIICGTKPCGARVGNTCAANEYCAYRVGEFCGAMDTESTCQLRPPGCNVDYHPVCGCDQRNYGNACFAATAGTGVFKQGTCDQ